MIVLQILNLAKVFFIEHRIQYFLNHRYDNYKAVCTAVDNLTLPVKLPLTFSEYVILSIVKISEIISIKINVKN